MEKKIHHLILKSIKSTRMQLLQNFINCRIRAGKYFKDHLQPPQYLDLKDKLLKSLRDLAQTQQSQDSELSSPASGSPSPLSLHQLPFQVRSVLNPGALFQFPLLLRWSCVFSVRTQEDIRELSSPKNDSMVQMRSSRRKEHLLTPGKHQITLVSSLTKTTVRSDLRNKLLP